MPYIPYTITSRTSAFRFLTLDASTSTYPASASVKAGDHYMITVAGTLPGIGLVSIGDQLVAKTDLAASAADYIVLEGNRSVLTVDAALNALPDGTGLVAGQQWKVINEGTLPGLGYVKAPNIVTALVDNATLGSEFVLMRESSLAVVATATPTNLTIDNMNVGYPLPIAAPVTTVPSGLTADDAGLFVEFFDPEGICGITSKDIVFPQGINNSGVSDTYHFNTDFAAAKFEWTGTTWRIVYAINT